MKLRHRFALSFVLTAAIAACGGGGGGGGSGSNGANNGTGSVTVPACASSDTTKGWLTDYHNTINTPKVYDQPVQGCVASIYNASTLAFANTTVSLTGDNIRAMIDAEPASATTGTAPTFSFYIATPAPNQASASSTIQLAITEGTDATRTTGESQVKITMNVVTQLENNELVMRSNGTQTVDVSAITGGNIAILNGSNPFQLIFSNNDVLARAKSTPAGTVLTVDAFGLLTKIYTLAAASNNDAMLLLLGLRAGNYPTAGNYTFSLERTSGDNLPLKTFTGSNTINNLSIGLPIN